MDALAYILIGIVIGFIIGMMIMSRLIQYRYKLTLKEEKNDGFEHEEDDYETYY